jgi:hypothetical protein
MKTFQSAPPLLQRDVTMKTQTSPRMYDGTTYSLKKGAMILPLFIDRQINYK